ncbi:Hint domain-containing protein [Oceaniglobus trochenteri]|uniref:Hint domain-containing protein n=1 Tax=Oceaniglobus trochenteri TaxID=2763260 RepID=UPI001CFF54C9|nr:Hint domain-containing protein [Oceaniglobus trochenteri]
MADTLASGLFISEILADNAGSTAIDTDGDGGKTKGDEFIEFQNASASTASLEGLQVWSQKNGLLYTFGPGAALAPGETATLVGEYTGPPPPGFYSAGIANNGNFLPDGENSKFDTLYLYDPGNNTYIALSYGAPPRDATPPAGFPSGATQSGSGESINSDAPNGRAFSRNSDGNFVESDPTPGTSDVVCLVAGTQIAVPGGTVAVEDLQPGQKVCVKDGPAQVLRAVGRTHLSAQILARLPMLAPVTLPVGAVGNDRALALSPNHRVAVSGPELDLLFGGGEFLVPAKCLAPAISPQGPQGVQYLHLLFDDHHLVLANGLWVESLYLGDVGASWVQGQRNLGTLREENAAHTDRITHRATARPCLRAFEMAALAGPARALAPLAA